MRYLNYTIEEFEKLDIPDYMILMEAVEYRENDKSFWVHFLAWQTMRANGKKKAGKGYRTAFPHFRQFYDAKKAEKHIRDSRKQEKQGSRKSRFGGLSEHLKQWRKGKEDTDG